MSVLFIAFSSRASVMIAFSRIESANEKGTMLYRSLVLALLWFQITSSRISVHGSCLADGFWLLSVRWNTTPLAFYVGHGFSVGWLGHRTFPYVGLPVHFICELTRVWWWSSWPIRLLQSLSSSFSWLCLLAMRLLLRVLITLHDIWAPTCYCIYG